MDSNIASNLGEIDVLMMHGETLVFVEVKMRKTASFGGALAAITPSKLKRLRQAIALYLQQNPQHAQRDCRIDAVCHPGCGGARRDRIQWLQNIDADRFQVWCICPPHIYPPRFTVIITPRNPHDEKNNEFHTNAPYWQ